MIKVRMATLLAALTLALLGCSDDDPEPKAEVDPTPSTTPLAPTSPTTTPTSTPTADPVTAVEAVRAWVSERNRALNSGDTTALRELTAGECASCEPYLDLIEDVYAAGGMYETRGWTVDTARELKSMEVTAAITMNGGIMVAAAGEPPDKYEVDKAIFRFRVKLLGDVLAVAFIGLVQ